jgi:DNA-binding IclR family transcriptional regulator
MDRQARLVETRDPAGAPSDLATVRTTIMAQGYASIFGDLVPGLRAAAAPVLDLQGNLVLVASLLAGVEFPASGDEQAAKALVETCARIGGSIGRDPVGAASSGDAAPPTKTPRPRTKKT